MLSIVWKQPNFMCQSVSVCVVQSVFSLESFCCRDTKVSCCRGATAASSMDFMEWLVGPCLTSGRAGMLITLDACKIKVMIKVCIMVDFM